MIAKDKNETLQPPAGELQWVTPIGSFLTLMYRTDKTQIAVYLNDQGREVLRTFEELPPPVPQPQYGLLGQIEATPAPVSWWEQLKKFFDLGW